jgi:hypothetical protein
MRPGFRLVSVIVLSVALVAAACGGRVDSTVNAGSARAGAGGRQSVAGGGGTEAAQAGKGADGEGGRAGSAGVNAGGSDACVPAAGDAFGVIEPLGNACDEFQCPASVADAAQLTLDRCGGIFEPRISYGCGTVTVDYSDYSGGTAYTFDAATNQVVRIRDGSDTPFGACHVDEYFYGGLGQSCPDAVTCYPCDDLRNDARSGAGAAGAAGETGSAGEAGAAGVGGAGTVPSIPHCPKFSEL